MQEVRNVKHGTRCAESRGETVTNAEKIEQAAAEQRRAYKREWNRKNRDKVKATQQRYWERKAAKALQEAENAD